jgi:hypothetical protein
MLSTRRLEQGTTARFSRVGLGSAWASVARSQGLERALPPAAMGHFAHARLSLDGRDWLTTTRNLRSLLIEDHESTTAGGQTKRSLARLPYIVRHAIGFFGDRPAFGALIHNSNITALTQNLNWLV